MKKLDTTQSGRYQWTMDGLVAFFIQMIYDLVSLFAGQGNCIITGCQLTQGVAYWQISAGWIAYNGTVYNIAAGVTTIPIATANPASVLYLYAGNTAVSPSPLPFETGATKNVCTQDVILYSDAGPGIGTLSQFPPFGSLLVQNAATAWVYPGSGGTAPALQAGWSVAGYGANAMRYRVFADRLELDGEVKAVGAQAGNSLLFTLPANARPANYNLTGVLFDASSANKFGLSIAATGEVELITWSGINLANDASLQLYGTTVFLS